MFDEELSFVHPITQPTEPDIHALWVLTSLVSIFEPFYGIGFSIFSCFDWVLVSVFEDCVRLQSLRFQDLAHLWLSLHLRFRKSLHEVPLTARLGGMVSALSVSDWCNQ
jgi:hypothetical protein